VNGLVETLMDIHASEFAKQTFCIATLKTT